MKTLRNLITIPVAVLATVLATGLSRADDTDLFNVNVSSNVQKPNILIILDNTANWSASLGSVTKYDAAKSALQTAVNSLQVDKVKAGLMLFNETGGAGSHDGSYVRYHVRVMNTSNKALLVALINGLDTPPTKAPTPTLPRRCMSPGCITVAGAS